MEIEKRYLEKFGIEELNAMQKATLSQYDDKRDFILLSPTGSGKTLAFALLSLQYIAKNKLSTPVVLIVVPSRELALQIEKVYKTMDSQIQTVCLYGGNDTRLEKNKLDERPEVIIGTPGRILYHVDLNPDLLKPCKLLILDEYDKSLELGFQEQLSAIKDALSKPIAKILTSASALEEFPEFIELNNPEKLQFLQDEPLVPNITQYKVLTTNRLKLEMLFKLICKLTDEKVIVFCNHRDAIDHISGLLQDKGIDCIAYHGGLDQFERELAVIKIKNGSQRVLIATDLAARGLDIPEMKNVIHYQLPLKKEEFLHRNGRSGRNQDEGFSYFFETEDFRMPEYLAEAKEIVLDDFYPIPSPTTFVTMRITAGKKQKVNKIDIVGFLTKFEFINKEDVGIIDVKSEESYVAINRTKIPSLLRSLADAKIKGKKVKIRVI